ncbi:MAG: TonB-dependent receptor plug domain-containing protein [Saprospiraceae bacterium]|nr:TonB-dependent receptor plug domain-containing protein [Saprospiraceae bacterium]
MKRNIQLALSIFCFLLITHLLSAQKSGFYLIDSDFKTPVQNAIVQLNGGNTFRVSDQNGFVNLNNTNEPVLHLTISSIGYETQDLAFNNEIINNSTSVISMVQKIVQLEEVTLNGSSGNSIFKTISDLDINLRPIINSQEVLRMVPGLFIGQHAGGGKAEQIFLRGFDLDHGTDINISVDGMPVNMVSHAHGQGYADLHFVIPELIEKVNFNKGPYFAEKGNFTTAGYVEFKTKDFLDNSFAKLEAGQFGTFRGVAGINLINPNAERRDQSLYIAGEGSFTKGFFDSPQNFSRYNGTMKYRGNINSNNIFKATMTVFSSKWNASGQIPDRAIETGEVGFFGSIDDTEGGSTSRYNASAEWLSYLSNGASLSNQLFYSKYKFELYSNFTFFKEDPINGDQIKQKENRDIFGYNGTYVQEYKIGNLNTETRAGIQIRYDEVKDMELTRTINRTEVSERIMLGHVNELNAGAYYTQKLSLSSKLDLTAGLRYDFFTNRYDDFLTSEMLSSKSGILSPKLNFNYIVNDKVQFYLYNGKGFHSNDTRVAVQQSGKKVLPPAYGSDLGGIFKLGNRVFLQTAVWYLWLDQEFVYVGDEGVVEAGGQSQRYGLDISTRIEIIKNLYADLDITLANPRALNVPQEESFLPLAPRFSSVGGLTYRKQSGFNGSIRYRYMADRPANEDNSVIAEGYFVTDLLLNYSQRRWELGLSVQNVFNTKWKETQFDTESKLFNENAPVSEIHFTPGSPFFARLHVAVFF